MKRPHPRDLPEPLRRALPGGVWRRDSVGESGADVWVLHVEERPRAFLKIGRDRRVQDVVDEYARLEWLARTGMVPRVTGFVRDADAAWLLTSALRGRTMQDLLEDEPERRPEIVRAAARFCRKLHALPIETCPFSAEAPFRLQHARANIDAGLVDEDDFDPDRVGWTAERVWSELSRLLPLDLSRVVAHGDFSTGNLLIENGEVVGCIDVGRVGIADPYQDLAILWNNLADYGPDLQAELWRAYGVETVDERRLLFHLLLDELF